MLAELRALATVLFADVADDGSGSGALWIILVIAGVLAIIALLLYILRR